MSPNIQAPTVQHPEEAPRTKFQTGRACQIGIGVGCLEFSPGSFDLVLGAFQIGILSNEFSSPGPMADGGEFVRVHISRNILFFAGSGGSGNNSLGVG